MPDSHLIHDIFPHPAESSRSLGFKLLGLNMSELSTRVQFDGKPQFTNPAGYIQGGFLSAMLDDTIGMLATMKVGAKMLPSTIDLHVQFLRPVRVGLIEVSAHLRNVGRNMIFANAELFDCRGKDAARATASLALNPMKAPAQRP